MSISPPLPTLPPAGTVPARDGASAGHVATLLGSAAGNQLGAAIGALAFPVLGPAGVVAVRQLVASTVLLPLARPSLRTLTRRDWVAVGALAAVLCTMNLALYVAIERLGLGLAVTLEFLGPLGVALVGSRRARDVAIALLAVVGVVLLVAPSSATDVIGVAIGLGAAGCWASYILLNRHLGQRFRGLEGPALATTIAAVAYLPWLVHVLGLPGTTTLAVAAAVGTGLLSSVLPYTVDLTLLRHVPRRTFAVLMSLHPALAAVAGLVVLRQSLAVHEVVGVLTVVVANTAAVRRSRR